MPQLLFILLIAVLLVVQTLAKWLYKGTQSHNAFLRNLTRGSMLLTLLFCLVYGIYIFTNRDIKAFNKLKISPDIIACQEFIDKYPGSSKKVEVIELMNKLYGEELYSSCDSLGLEKFINKYSFNYRYKEEYKHPFIEKAIELLNIEKERLEKEYLEKMRRWNSEKSAWNAAKEEGTLTAYQLYLKLYPKGRHHKQAEKKVIDLEVADIFRKGGYGSLPSMNRENYVKGPYSTIYIRNDTKYDLTLLYSGVESKRVTISPYGSVNLRLKSGIYQIVASVNAVGISKFAGEENLSGGSYSVTYYIQTTRY